MTQDIFKEDMEKAKVNMEKQNNKTDGRGSDIRNKTANNSILEGYQAETEEEIEELEVEREEREKLSEEKEFAEDMLNKRSFVIKDGLQETIEKRTELGNEGLELSKEYKAKKLEIENSDLKLLAKGEALNELHDTYHKKMSDIIQDQANVNNEYIDKKIEVANKLYKSESDRASRHDFSEKDLSYIMYVIDNGNEDSIVDLVKEYKYNPFLIKLVNTKYEKLPENDRLIIKHPLSIIAEGAFGKEHKTNKQLLMMIKGQNYGAPIGIETLIPQKDVPRVDPWSKYKKEDKTGWA